MGQAHKLPIQQSIAASARIACRPTPNSKSSVFHSNFEEKEGEDERCSEPEEERRPFLPSHRCSVSFMQKSPKRAHDIERMRATDNGRLVADNRDESKALKKYADEVARTNLFPFEKHKKNFPASRLKGQNTCARARARGTSEQ